MHLIEELILKKRNGFALGKDEISAFVEGISNHNVSDAQIAAFTMAIWFRGMSLEEKTTLTLAMRDSGEVLTWQDLDGPIVDKHSTGGIGDATDWTLTIVRTELGRAIIIKMLEEGVIEAKPGDSDPGAIALMHKLAQKSRQRWPDWANPEAAVGLPG